VIDRVKKYRLIYDFHALDTKMSEHLGREISRLFPKDSVIEAELHDATFVVHKNRFLIPIDYLQEISEKDTIDSGTNIKEGKTLDDFVIKSSKSKVTESKNKAMGFVKGGVVGMALGVVLALYLKKNPFWWGATGFIVGGYSLNKLKK
jgi:hypothetical protein